MFGSFHVSQYQDAASSSPYRSARCFANASISADHFP
jgi:hypothetical protein